MSAKTRFAREKSAMFRRIPSFRKDILEMSSPLHPPVWIDADPSALFWSGLDCDDDLAILAALAQHRRRVIDLRGLSICGGNAPLAHTWRDARMLWEYVDGRQLTGISPVKGRGWNSMQVAVGLLRFINALFPDEDDSDDASDALAEQLLRRDTDPINILTLGPTTNLAKAMQKIQSSPSSHHDIHVHHIFLMGGEMTNRTLDLNFRSDRGSTRAIIESDLPTTIIPIQTCAQTAIAEEHLDRLRCDAAAAAGHAPAVCALLPKMRQQVRWMPLIVNRAVKERMTPRIGTQNDNDSGNEDIRWRASPNLDRGFIPWDLVALLAITHPEEFADWEYHRVSMPPCGNEPCDGTMLIVQDLGATYFDDGRVAKNWSGIVRVPHTVRNETRLVEMMLELMAEVPAASPVAPGMRWGYFGGLAGFAIASIVFLRAAYRLMLNK